MATKETPEWAPLPQMTFKKMGCDPKDAVRKEQSVYMCRVFGEASDMKTKEAKNGDLYSYLVGEFRGISSEGKKFEAQKLFLPGGILEQIEAALKAANGKPVQFGYDVYATPDDNSVGYRYAAKTLLKSEASDRLTEITKALSEKKPEKVVEKK